MKIPGPTVLKTFRRRLTNLSSRNRSLLLTTLPTGQFLDLHETDFLLNKPSFSIVAELIGRKSSAALCEVLDARQERSNEVSRKLRRLERTSRFIQEERGTEDLYVGWPFVRGKFLDDTVVHGPLLFFPVEIEQQGKLWKIIRRGDELAFLNPTLALAYGQFNQVKLSDDVLEKTLDDFDRDPLVFRTQLHEWLKTTPLEINFNADLFADKLQFFNKQSAKDLAQLERIGELKLFPEAVLGIFPQAGSFLVPDYDRLLTEDIGQGAEGDGLDESVPFAPNPFPSAFLPEQFIHTPLPMDASQEAAVRAVKAGQSLVVQGPPGTGKSQLIANLMADAAASGKRVLLVCQKRAALDVVQQRLHQVGMAPFLALVHDFQDDRPALYAQIAGQISQVEVYRQQNNGLNAVLLERDFEIVSRRIDETVIHLRAFKDALFDTSECGLSAKELYLTSKTNAPLVSLEDSYQQFPLSNVDNFVQRLTDYADYQQRLGEDYLWRERVSFASFSSNDLGKAVQIIDQWTQLRDTANNQASTLLGQLLTLNQWTDWLAQDKGLSTLLSLVAGQDVADLWTVVNQLRSQPNYPASQIIENKLEQVAQNWEQLLTLPEPELSLETTALRSFRTLLAEVLIVRSSWLNWNWWQFTNAVSKEKLQAIVLANNLTLQEADLQTLAVKVDKRIKLEATRYEARALLTDLSLPETPDSLRLLRRARHVVEQLGTIPPLQGLPEFCWQTYEQFAQTVKSFVVLATTIQQQRTAAQAYLTNNQLDQIWLVNLYADHLRHALRRDFDFMVENDRLQEGFSVGEQVAVERLKNVKPADWVESFRTSLQLAWLNHIEAVYPELRSVSSLKMDQWERLLQESVLQKQTVSRDRLLVKLREQTYRNLTHNRLNNVVTYRDLLHQTTKKRTIWPVRKLMEFLADEVFKLVPCWLASPESVSAMFPLRKGLFDLVIFDEASQCFAENGIPAIARGKQIVVVGDNQQLRPSDLYKIRLDDTDQAEETPIALEVESLLELAAQQLPQVSLMEHYRSRSLDLITFSNEHFYGNKLALLPHFDEINRQEPAIRYINVKGIWQQSTNIIEADAVCQLLSQLAAELPGRSVGIVTFNYAQQQLIQDRLEETVDAATLPPDLFVKNIENVQGDERDVIIFSIGYAPDERGRLAMQFGSLNARGGENRLNVAVTRARERVYVITSIWPDQLAVSDTANEGPKLLKAYLTYALEVAQRQFQPRLHHHQFIPSSILLKDQLAAVHADWKPELPFADLTVKDGEKCTSLILTDDDAYYQQTTKYAHAYLPIALQARNWPFQRLWSREFRQDVS